MSLKVFVCGEGTDDIGRWAIEVAYRDASPRGDGAIGELARRVVAEGWTIVDGRALKNVPVLRTGKGLKQEAVRFHGAMQLAREKGCDVVLFARDTDGDEERTRQLRDLRATDADRVALAVVEPVIEGWALELSGERRKGGWTRKAAQDRVDELQLDLEATARGWTGSRDDLSPDLQQWLADVLRVLVKK
jgi:hypothetical protein